MPVAKLVSYAVDKGLSKTSSNGTGEFEHQLVTGNPQHLLTPLHANKKAAPLWSGFLSTG
jgi:hypothetical protein